MSEVERAAKNAQLRAVITAWAGSNFARHGLTTRRLIIQAETELPLFQALLGVAENPDEPGKPGATQLGAWLRQNYGSGAAGWRIGVDRRDAHRPRWRLEPL
jgi:hypothetical protein